MTSDWYITHEVKDSQNFILQLSENSTIEDTQELVANNKKKMEVIAISDSSSSLSPEQLEKFKNPISVSKSRNKKKITRYQKLHILETSSESETERFNLTSNRVRANNNIFLDRRHINKNIIQANKISYTSDDTATSSSERYDKDIENQIRSDIKKSCKSSTLMFVGQRMKTDTNKDYDIKQTNIVTPKDTLLSNGSNVLSKLNKSFVRTTQQNKAGKTILTKLDARKIFQNIKSTQVVYNTPREIRNTDAIIINESTEIDEDEIHPAISPRSNKEVKHHIESPDVIETSLKDNIIPDSQSTSLEACEKHVNKSSKLPLRNEDLHRPLSERKKKQITQWLMANPDYQSDSSCSNIPASTKNSMGSGNSSLERLEQNYETPNNRGKINKIYTDERPITNYDEVILLPSDEIISNGYTQKYKNSESYTLDRTKLSPKRYMEKKTSLSPVVSTLNNANVKNYASILDKLYGVSWRDKANMLLPTVVSSDKLTPINKSVETERELISENRHSFILDESNLDEDNDKPISVKGTQQRHKRKEDSFINDESLSSNNSESIYHTALTNPRFFKNASASTQKSMPIPVSTQRIRLICDIDTEDELDDKFSNNTKRYLHKKRLSFSDSSETSEFDPGDYVPPKFTLKKGTTKIPVRQPSEIIPKKSATTKKLVEYEDFLTSLSDTTPMSIVHPDAKKYRLDYKKRKEELCEKLYKLYNEKIFNNELPHDMTIQWSARMRGSAGYCYNKKSGSVKSSKIVLATKILDTPDRLRDTLIHEMCHAAAWLLNDVSNGHGPFWMYWVKTAMKMFSQLPPIRQCHNYVIKTKYTYRCTDCGYSIHRHSKSLDIERDVCGHCHGNFELFINKTTKSGTMQVRTIKREPNGFALYVKKNYNSVKQKNMRHAEVMKILGQQFSAIKIAKRNGPHSGPEMSD